MSGFMSHETSNELFARKCKETTERLKRESERETSKSLEEYKKIMTDDDYLYDVYGIDLRDKKSKQPKNFISFSS